MYGQVLQLLSIKLWTFVQLIMLWYSILFCTELGSTFIEEKMNSQKFE